MARRQAALAALVAPACAVVAGSLVWAGRTLPDREPALATRAVEAMPATGVSNVVTSVLLDFRAYDTLLEIGVLVLALAAVWSFRKADGGDAPAGGGSSRAAASEKRAHGGMAGGDASVLEGLALLVAPVAVVIAGYLWWAGSYVPGGAFQAGAVLGAAAVLLILVGRIRVGAFAGTRTRMAAAAGLLAFLSVAGGASIAGRAFLDHPPAHAGTIIFLLEGVLTGSIGVILSALFADACSSGTSPAGDA